jgi:hypothetical protein
MYFPHSLIMTIHEERLEQSCRDRQYHAITPKKPATRHIWHHNPLKVITLRK